MRHEFKDRFTDAVILTEEVPDDSPNALRTALEQFAMRGQTEVRLAALRNETTELIEDLDASDPERKLLEYRIAAIDREIAAPRARAYLAGAYLDRAYLAGAYLDRANLDGAYLVGANLDGANLARANLVGAYLDGAYLVGANLVGANLARANLARANLDGANLVGANLARANLARANLDGANLVGANLARANLARAYLDGANLARAYLDGANLDGANLDGANLDGAYLARANLARANLVGAYLDGANGLPSGDRPADPVEPYVRPTTPEQIRALYARIRDDFRARHPEVPVVEQLDAKILAEVEANRLTLDMGSWHGDHAHGASVQDACGTTHCRAGSAVHLAGAAGYALERKLGSAEQAGFEIYMASTGRAPYFYGSTEAALEDIRRCAAEQAASAGDEGKAP